MKQQLNMCLSHSHPHPSWSYLETHVRYCPIWDGSAAILLLQGGLENLCLLFIFFFALAGHLERVSCSFFKSLAQPMGCSLEGLGVSMYYFTRLVTELVNCDSEYLGRAGLWWQES